MTIARLAGIGAVLLAIVALAIVLLGASSTRPYVLYFENAGQLVQGNDVQVAGRRVGSIVAIELTSDNRAKISVRVEEPYAPLREGTRAVIRATSLSGVANRYIALTPGDERAKELPDGAALRESDTRSIVDLDQFFAIFDERTRGDLQGVIKGFATQFEGRGDEANAAAAELNPLLGTSRRLLAQLGRDEEALTRFLVNTGAAMTALAERRGDLTALVGNAGATAAAVAAEDESLARALEVLPTTLRRANTTFVNLRATLDDLDPVIAESRPATRELAPFFRALRPLARDARPTVADLRALVSRPGAGNDATEATRRLPRLASVAAPAFRQSERALRDATPVLEFARPYTPDLVGWFRGFGQGAAAYDANGHYARVQPVFNAFQHTDTPDGGVLTPRPLRDRFAGQETGILQRCPGAATQPAPDGSSPFTDGDNLADGDCRPQQAPPGP